MNAIDKLISIAEAEVGYLEKKSNSQLENKTANAGSGNYTKYWAQIKPEFQSQPWCACFVTWLFVKAFGKDMATRLLRHYPYVYCPAMKGLFTLNANPKRGDIVVFYRNGAFAHTGVVTGVSGDKFTTIEGNTSGGSTIVSNGGAVCKKSYNISQLPGTRFASPDYSIIDKEDEPMTTEERKQFNGLVDAVENLTKEVDALRAKTGYYNYIDNNMPKDYRSTIQMLVERNLLQGNERGELMLTTEMMRILTILNRAGVFG